MTKSYWMIIAGSILILGVLTNTVFGQRVQNYPLDIVDADENKFSVIVPAKEEPGLDIKAPTLSSYIFNVTEQNTLATAEFDFEKPLPAGLIPDRIKIPSINLDAPITPVDAKEITYNGKTFQQWLAPNEYAVGWHSASAKLGDVGNTVLNGHHNAFGQVFFDLHKVNEGEVISIYSGDNVYEYYVARRLLLPEKFNTVENRMENAVWISQSTDERLTLITCWPPESNIYRVIVVAVPVE